MHFFEKFHLPVLAFVGLKSVMREKWCDWENCNSYMFVVEPNFHGHDKRSRVVYDYISVIILSQHIGKYSCKLLNGCWNRHASRSRPDHFWQWTVKRAPQYVTKCAVVNQSGTHIVAVGLGLWLTTLWPECDAMSPWHVSSNNIWYDQNSEMGV